jgi:hypothetical protein
LFSRTSKFACNSTDSACVGTGFGCTQVPSCISTAASAAPTASRRRMWIDLDSSAAANNAFTAISTNEIP